MRMRRNKKATEEQKLCLLKYMEKNPLFAQDKYTGADAAHRRAEEWERVAKMLNNVQGAEKDGPKWRKYWMDQRGHLKEREALLKVNFQRNGQKGLANLKPLTDIEKRMLRVFGQSNAYEKSPFNSESTDLGQEVFALQIKKRGYSFLEKQDEEQKEEAEELLEILSGAGEPHEQEEHEEHESTDDTQDDDIFLTEFVTCANPAEDETSVASDVAQTTPKRQKLSSNECAHNKCNDSKKTVAINSIERQQLRLEIAKLEAENSWKNRTYELEFRKLELESKRLDLESRKLDFEIAKYECEKMELTKLSRSQENK